MSSAREYVVASRDCRRFPNSGKRSPLNGYDMLQHTAMRSIFLLLALLISAPVLSQTRDPVRTASTWFTLQGDSDSAMANTVQVEPETVLVFENMRTMKVRVSRSAERMGYDGMPYRSFEATAKIDCGDSTARYQHIKFYREPIWKGTPREASFSGNAMPDMAFRSMEPNPASRIVSAACFLGLAKDSTKGKPQSAGAAK